MLEILDQQAFNQAPFNPVLFLSVLHIHECIIKAYTKPLLPFLAIHWLDLASFWICQPENFWARRFLAIFLLI